jgi:hypothetical protein
MVLKEIAAGHKSVALRTAAEEALKVASMPAEIGAALDEKEGDDKASAVAADLRTVAASQSDARRRLGMRGPDLRLGHQRIERLLSGPSGNADRVNHLMCPSSIDSFGRSALPGCLPAAGHEQSR